MTANSGSLQKFDNSCTARIFSLHDFQTILNAKSHAPNSRFGEKMRASVQPVPRVPRIEFINQLSAPFTADSAPAGELLYIGGALTLGAKGALFLCLFSSLSPSPLFSSPFLCVPPLFSSYLLFSLLPLAMLALNRLASCCI